MPKIVVSDCDLTIWCGHLYEYSCQSENEDLIYELENLVAQGYELILWSGAGESHAANVGKRLSLPVSRAYEKVSHPITDEKVIELLGQMPDIQYDDAVNERIPGISDFRLVENYNPHGYVLMRGLWTPTE